MPTHLIGAHMPTSKGLGKAVRAGADIGCTAVQVFTSSPQMWHSKDVTDDMVDDLTDALKDTGMRGKIVCHDSYLINLCSVNPETKEKSFNALKRELERSAKLGIPYVVSHLGAHKDQGEEEGIKIVAKQLKKILADTPKEVTVLAETTAGQGSSLFYKFEHLGMLLDLLDGDKRCCVCMDTCHIFSAGYDIRDEDSYKKTMKEFDKTVGVKRIKAIHANDSKHGLGSRKDRHEAIGEGEIGERAFELLVNDKRFAKTPILVETPNAEEMHEVNVQRLWDLVKA